MLKFILMQRYVINAKYQQILTFNLWKRIDKIFVI